MSKTGFPVRRGLEAFLPAPSRTLSPLRKLNAMKSTIEPPKSRAKKPATAKSIPKGMHSITPHLICAGAAKAIDFYKKAFGAEEVLRLKAPNGALMHANVRIGDSSGM